LRIGGWSSAAERHRQVPGPWNPKPVADGIEIGRTRFIEHGVGAEFCVFGLAGRDDVEAVVADALRARPWECVVIGGGVRNQLDLFERMVNLVRRHAPDAAIAFNTTPTDTFETAVRLRRIRGGDHLSGVIPALGAVMGWRRWPVPVERCCRSGGWLGSPTRRRRRG
jgi:hypothetical protein